MFYFATGLAWSGKGGGQVDLPVEYSRLTPEQRREVREEYAKKQNGLCCFCQRPLAGNPPRELVERPIRWGRFPTRFLDNPVHLHHDHKTGMTVGAIHAFCNAYSFDYIEEPHPSSLARWSAWRHRMVVSSQMKAAERYSDAVPSAVSEVSWIYAVRKEGEYPKPTAKSGKWLVFGNPDRIDEMWTKVKAATRQGALGGFSKVATAHPNPNAPNSDRRVICVYTYNSDDFQDVRRVRETLRSLGVTEKTGYKTDEKTREGVYLSRGFTPEEVWKYQE